MNDADRFSYLSYEGLIYNYYLFSKKEIENKFEKKQNYKKIKTKFIIDYNTI